LPFDDQFSLFGETAADWPVRENQTAEHVLALPGEERVNGAPSAPIDPLPGNGDLFARHGIALQRQGRRFLSEGNKR
jgi:hypothetical protein